MTATKAENILLFRHLEAPNVTVEQLSKIVQVSNYDIKDLNGIQVIPPMVITRKITPPSEYNKVVRYSGYSFRPDPKYKSLDIRISPNIWNRLDRTISITYPEEYHRMQSDDVELQYGVEFPLSTIFYDIPDGVYVVWEDLLDAGTYRYTVGNYVNGYREGKFKVLLSDDKNSKVTSSHELTYHRGKLIQVLDLNGFLQNIKLYKDDFIYGELSFADNHPLSITSYNNGYIEDHFLIHKNNNFEKGKLRCTGYSNKSIKDWLHKQLEEKISNKYWRPTNNDYFQGDIIGYHYINSNTTFTDHLLRYNDEGKLHGISEFYTSSSQIKKFDMASWFDEWREKQEKILSDDAKCYLPPSSMNEPIKYTVKYKYYLDGKKCRKKRYESLIKDLIVLSFGMIPELNTLIVKYI